MVMQTKVGIQIRHNWYVPLLVISVLACFMLHLQIVNNEEPFLQEVFGEEYLEYKSRSHK